MSDLNMALLQVDADCPVHLSHRGILHLCVYSAEVLGLICVFFLGGGGEL